MIRKYIPLLAAIGLIALGWVIYAKTRPEEKLPEPDSRTETPEARATITQIGDTTRYSSGLSNRAHAVLPDGTRMILNPNTEVLVPKASGDTSYIRVNGDAYFALPGAKGKPIIALTKDLILTTLDGGQAFRISSFDKDEGESVEVLNGMVKATKAYSSKDNEPELLNGGDMVMINRSIDLMEKETFDSTTLRTWVDDRLVFQNASMDTVIRQLQDWFGITVDVSGNPDNVPNVTASFANAGLEEVLDGLSKTYHCKYTIGKYTAQLAF